MPDSLLSSPPCVAGFAEQGTTLFSALRSGLRRAGHYSLPSLPLVTALCPTYGRFSRLREALACFLAQDYPNKQLIILNDAPERIVNGSEQSVVSSGCLLTTHYSPLTVVNRPDPFNNLGEKRQWLLEHADSPLCAHWDDDDLYLPWHLSICVEALLKRPEPKCVRPHGAWYWPSVASAKEGRPDGEVHGIHHNVFEGQMVFDRQRALELGGYSQKHSGQAADLLWKFGNAGEIRKFEPKPGPSYVYRWDRAFGHISALASSRKGMEEGRNVTALKEFQHRNTDFGDGQPLTPAELTPYWHAVLESARKVLSKDGYAAFGQRLNATEPQSTQRKEKTRVEDEKEKEDAFLLSLCQFAPSSVLSVPRWLT